MPYAVMVSRGGQGRERVWEPTDIVYENGQEAGLFVKNENTYTAMYDPFTRYRAVKISDDNPLLWRQREQRRFDEGIYQKVPWADETWGSNTGMYEHIDPDDPTKVRFIANQEDGLAGRYTSMSPGRFINKFIGGGFDPRQIDRWCAQMGLDQTTSELRLAKTAEDIIRVYNDGPHSCMAYPLDHPVFGHLRIHPVSVYGDSDLAVAYIERYDEITARCLVWPEKKQHGRIYGDRERLVERLKENNYVENWNFTGAKIRKVLNPQLRFSQLVVPYLDGDVGLIELDDTWYQISDKPHIICKEPNGGATADQCIQCGAQGVWLIADYGPDDDWDEPEWKCAEGCKK
jgi:hypothetical protein